MITRITIAKPRAVMASINSLTTPQSFHPLSKPNPKTTKQQPFYSLKPPSTAAKLFSRTKGSVLRAGSVSKDLDIIPLQSSDGVDQQQDCIEKEAESSLTQVVVSGFGADEVEAKFSLEVEGAGAGAGAGAGYASSSSSSSASLPPPPVTNGEGGDGGGGGGGEEDVVRLTDRAINASIVLAAGTFAVTKLLTIDHDYWQGWTIYEILRYAPQHNWSAYEEALKTNPVFAKMVISGVVYAVGDWIAQCVEGKPLFEFDRTRMFRSGLVGFTLHGSLSHYYYQFCEALFPFDDWWVVPAKVAFDQTFWSGVWNSIYYAVLGILRFESPLSIYSELKATFWPMLTASWKLWPFAHLITYGVIPVEQRLLWVDCIELIWVTILSAYSNEKSEARISEASSSATSANPSSTGPPEE